MRSPDCQGPAQGVIGSRAVWMTSSNTGALPVLSHLILAAVLGGRNYYYSHCTEREPRPEWARSIPSIVSC